MYKRQVLNYILIYGKLGFPAMGITGAAIATTLSRSVAMIMALLAIYHPDSLLSLSKRKGLDVYKRQKKGRVRCYP